MADVLVSMLLEQLGLLARENMKEEVRLINGVEKEIDNLSRNLQAIQAVLPDAEERQVTEVAVRGWLDELKDVSNELDDVLDECITAIDRETFEDDEGYGTLIEKEGEKDDKDTLSVKKIKELDERLGAVSMEKAKYNFNTRVINEQLERRKITPVIDMPEMYGRDVEKEVLMSKLLCESCQDGMGLDVILIVGVGGIGKTTLARLAYDDNQVKAHFEERIWLRVSPLNIIRIATAIIEFLEGSASNVLEVKSLLKCVQQSVEGRRFLLVLDDLWIEDAKQWEPLKAALQKGAAGSKILVTTQKKEVAIMVGEDPHMVSIEALPEEVCWTMFSQLAFFGRNRCGQLEEIGKQIAMKCKGVPLVAKILGSLMRFKEGRQQWEDVLLSKLWEIEDVEMKSFVPFLLSYNDLSSVEKRCLSFCSIFPKDHKIRKEDLIEMWMSQGYLSWSNIKSSEKAGQDCFDSLAMRDFFQDFERDYDGNIVTCKMHDMVHDFIQFLTENECCIMEVDGVRETMNHTKETTRHATFLLDSAANMPSSILLENKRLRTLFVTLSQQLNNLSSEMFLNLTCLRTLSFRDGTFEQLPEGIDKLVHLRYLSLCHNSFLKELPNSLCRLFNLQTLKVKNCHRIKQLPKGIGKLVNLRHLYVDGCENLQYLPKGIGKLTCLRTLDMFVVPHHENNEALKLEDLTSLVELDWHFIHVLGCFNLQNAESEQLRGKENLANLNLTFYSRNGRDGNEILEALQPHENLKSLEIREYYGDAIDPSWMMTLTNLKKLTLHCCVNCESLPPLGKLPSLESLYLEDLDSVEKLGLKFLGIETDKSDQISFPKLKLLRFHFLHHWRVWEGKVGGEKDSCEVITMPSLQSLEISFCSRLEALPDFLQTTPLRNLMISSCRSLQKRCRERVGKDWLKISHVPNIKIDECFDGEGDTNSDYSESETSQSGGISPTNEEQLDE